MLSFKVTRSFPSSKAILARRRLASFDSTRITNKYAVGTNLSGYEIKDVIPIPEFSCVAVMLKHKLSGSEHLHLDNPVDRNNVFSIAFKTNPSDSTGVPHILEHTTLCGSYKYPVRDPFFKMLNRSLSNFMNAMTAHDHTYYPFATTNSRDFDNLMDVYLSSVFEPLLTFEDFCQEGWRLERNDISSAESPMEFKGVVYNEMKGQYANSAYYFWIKFQESIYASLHNSGGDPKNITDLSYESLIDFHSRNYHPSNSRTYTYGNLPLSQHLRKLDEAFRPFGFRNQRNEIRQPNVRLDPTSPSEIKISGPVDVMCGKPVEEQYKVSITWELGDPLNEENHYDLFKWKILSSLLCDGVSSPFYKELIEKGFGDDFSVNTGLDNTSALYSFSVGFNNVSKQNVDACEESILKVLKENFVPELRKDRSVLTEHVEAIMHQIELGFKKHKPDLGLGLLNSILPGWVNGIEPIALLKVDEKIARFKKEFEEQGLSVFEEMLNKTLLNPKLRRVKYVMEPSESFASDLSEEENSRLQSKVSNLSKEDIEHIDQRSSLLAERQQIEEDISVLPTLGVHDISRHGEFYNLDISSVNDKKLQKRVISTNGLIYMTAYKDLSYLPEAYYKYMPLFCACLTGLAGTSSTKITDLEAKIQKYTGGISFSTQVKALPKDISQASLKFVVSSMALGNNSSMIYDLLHEILTETRFDANDPEVVDKLSPLIKSSSQNQMNTLVERGHSFASSSSGSHLSPSKYVSDQLNGISQMEFISSLSNNLESDGKEYLRKEVLPVFEKLRTLVLNSYTERTSKGFSYSLIGDEELILKNEKLVEAFDNKILSGMDSAGSPNILESVCSKFSATPIKNGSIFLDLPIQIGYSSLAKLGSSYDSEDGAPLQILAQLTTFKHLHSVIRESNGAYGGGLSFDGLNGILNFYSYRDPNPITSIDSFRSTFDVLNEALSGSTKARWTSTDLEEAKLAVFQSIDAPSSISTQGSEAFLENIDDSMRQRRRERFLDTYFTDIERVAEKYLSKGPEIATVIGNAKDLQINSNNPDWKIKNFT